jgi:hypothetical protein
MPGRSGLASALEAVVQASWLSISQNIVGLHYEVIVEERFRHQLGQFYTPEDVVEVLTAFASQHVIGRDMIVEAEIGSQSPSHEAPIPTKSSPPSHDADCCD